MTLSPRRRVCVCCIASILLVSWPGAGQAITQVGNGIYDVFVNDASDPVAIGVWTATTASAHPAGSGRDVLYRNGVPGTGFSTIRVYGTGGTTTDYVNRPFLFGSVDLDPAFVSEGPSPLAAPGEGWQTVWAVPGLTITQDLVVVGTVPSSSAIYHTIEVTNDSPAPIDVGLRNLYDWSLNDPTFSDGPGNQLELADGTVVSALTFGSFTHAPVTAGVARVTMGAGATYEPLLGLTYDPGLHPSLPTTQPDAYAFGAWPGMVGSIFDHNPGAGPDTAGLTWFGRTAASAYTIAPGTSQRFTQVIFAVLANSPASAPEVCPSGAAQFDFDDLYVSGSGSSYYGTSYSRDGFDLSSPSASLIVYGDAHPYYTGSPGITSDFIEYWITRQGGGTFDLCSFDAAAHPVANSPFARVMLAGGAYEDLPISAVAPSEERLVTSIATGVSLARIQGWALPVPANVMAIDDVCLCPTGACTCPAVLSAAGSSFCVRGESNGIGWSWRTSSTGAVDVPGQPVGASAAAIAAAFVASINTAALGPTATVDGTDPTCFDLTVPPGDQLLVGAFAQQPGCVANLNPDGCAFNPILYDQKILSRFPAVPTSSPLLMWIAAATLAAAGLWAMARWGDARASR